MSQKKICEVTRSLFNLILGILPVIFWCCLIYSFDETVGAGITILAMIIHELGHLVCIFFITGRWEKPKGTFDGLRISEKRCSSYPQQMLQYGSGAVSNLIAAALMPLCVGLNEYSEIFLTINLATAISNLLPLEGYDGYRLIYAAISYFDLGFFAYLALEIISFLFTAFLALISMFFVYTFGNGYWFMAVFLFATVKKLQKWQKYENSR